MWVLLSSLILYGYQWRFSFSVHLMHKYTWLYFGKIKYGQNTFSVLVGNAIIEKTPLISTLPQPWLHELSINCQGGKMINKPFSSHFCIVLEIFALIFSFLRSIPMSNFHLFSLFLLLRLNNRWFHWSNWAFEWAVKVSFVQTLNCI